MGFGPRTTGGPPAPGTTIRLAGRPGSSMHDGGRDDRVMFHGASRRFRSAPVSEGSFGIRNRSGREERLSPLVVGQPGGTKRWPTLAEYTAGPSACSESQAGSPAALRGSRPRGTTPVFKRCCGSLLGAAGNDDPALECQRGRVGNVDHPLRDQPFDPAALAVQGCHDC
jgi:hypothetical protein